VKASNAGLRVFNALLIGKQMSATSAGDFRDLSREGAINGRLRLALGAETELPMTLEVIGAVLMIIGVAMAAVRTAGRGRLSQPNAQTSARPDTLEPTGKGRRLSLRADLPGLGMVALGAILILAGALS
jgi:hypothetical protein